MVAPTDREKSFTARNGDPYVARRLFSKPHDSHKGAEKWSIHAMLSGPSIETCCPTYSAGTEPKF